MSQKILLSRRLKIWEKNTQEKLLIRHVMGVVIEAVGNRYQRKDMIMDSVFQIVDSKISLIEAKAKRPVVIVINADLFKQIQQEMFTRDISQVYGKIRSPYALQVYKGCTVIPSQVVESVEVF